MSEFLEFLQWPAMLVTIAAAWFVACNHAWKRNVGFWLFLLSNVLWVVWGLHDHAYALIALQIGLAILNIRGAFKTEKAEKKEASTDPSNA